MHKKISILLFSFLIFLAISMGNVMAAPVLNDTIPVNGTWINDATSGSTLFQVEIYDDALDTSTAKIYRRKLGIGQYTAFTLTCYDDGSGAHHTCNTSLDISALIAEGEYIEYFFNASNTTGEEAPNAGTNGTWDDGLWARDDETAPVAGLPEYTNGTLSSSGQQLILNISVSDSLSGVVGQPCNVTIGGIAVAEAPITESSGWCNSTVTIPAGLSSGNNTINVSINDSADNFGSLITYVVDIDNTAPVISIVSPLNTTYNYSSLWFNVTLDTDGSTCRVSISGLNHSLTNSTGNWNYFNDTTLSDGGYTAIFYCNDSFGNMNSTQIIFSIDSVEPVLFIKSPENKTYTIRNITFNVTSFDWNIDSCFVEDNSRNYTLTQMYPNQNVTNETELNWTNTTIVTDPENAVDDDWDSYAYVGGINDGNITINWTIPNIGVTNITIDSKYDTTIEAIIELYIYNFTSGSWVQVFSRTSGGIETRNDTVNISSYGTTDVLQTMIFLDSNNNDRYVHLYETRMNYTYDENLFSFYNASATLGNHYARFYCNDSFGNMNSSQIVYFEIVATLTINIYDEMTGDSFNMSLINQTRFMIFCDDRTITEYRIF